MHYKYQACLRYSCPSSFLYFLQRSSFRGASKTVPRHCRSMQHGCMTPTREHHELARSLCGSYGGVVLRLWLSLKCGVDLKQKVRLRSNGVEES